MKGKNRDMTRQKTDMVSQEFQNFLSSQVRGFQTHLRKLVLSTYWGWEIPCQNFKGSLYILFVDDTTTIGSLRADGPSSP